MLLAGFIRHLRSTPSSRGVVHVSGKRFSEVIEDLDVRTEHRAPRSALAVLVASRRGARHTERYRDRLLAHARPMAELPTTGGGRQTSLQLHIRDCPLEPVQIYHGYRVSHRTVSVCVIESVSPREQSLSHGDDLPYEGVSAEWSWVRHSLDDKWVVAYRITEQNGEHVVDEVRVYPREPDADSRRAVGWSGDPRAVAPGGVTTRLLRKVKVATALAAGDHSIQVIGTVLPPELAPKGKVAHRPRRRRRDDLLLARVAIRYDDARAAGSLTRAHKAWELLRELDNLYYTPGSVRQLIAAARKRGFITPTREGAGRGRATDEARAVIDAHTRNSSTPTRPTP